MIVVFSIFVALFPIVHLYRENIDKVDISLVYPSMLTALLVTFIGWGAIWAMTRNIRKSALVISWLMMLFSFYYTYSGWIAQIVVVLLISNWLIYFIIKSKSDFRALVAFLNASSMVAVGIPGYYITKALISPPSMELREVPGSLTDKQIAMKGTTPNVYFIILDGYGGQKALEEYYMTKNSRFVEFLRDEGFWVSNASRSKLYENRFVVVGDT
jgi:hypothetical protein